MISSYISLIQCFLKLSSNLNDLNSTWKCPRCLPEGEIAVPLSQILYLFIVFSLVMFIFSLFLDVFSFSNKALLIGLSVSRGISAVPSMILFAISWLHKSQFSQLIVVLQVGWILLGGNVICSIRVLSFQLRSGW